MIRIEVGPRLVKTARKLGPAVRAEAEERLAQLTRGFGNPHAHAGLGLRKIGKRSYEVRLSRQLRLVLVLHEGQLLAYDILTHDGVIAWLKGRKGR